MVVATHSLYASQTSAGSSYVFADLLVLKLREGSTENWGQIISPSGPNQTIALLDVPFHWQAGFRAGVGYHFAQNQYDTRVAYTRYKTQSTQYAAVESGGIYSAYLANFYVNNSSGANFGPNYFNAGMEWDFLYNVVDLEIGHTFIIDKMLLLRPLIGLKTASIQQKIHTTWQNPSVTTNFSLATENLKNNFWGIGPYIGLDSTWFLFHNGSTALKLFGNITGGLLSGHWTFSDNYENNAPLSIDVNSSNINTAATMMIAQLGIEWSGCVIGNGFTARLGYEAQVWFNQVQYYSFNMGRLDNLMSLQGGLFEWYMHF